MYARCRTGVCLPKPRAGQAQLCRDYASTSFFAQSPARASRQAANAIKKDLSAMTLPSGLPGQKLLPVPVSQGLAESSPFLATVLVHSLIRAGHIQHAADLVEQFIDRTKSGAPFILKSRTVEAVLAGLSTWRKGKALAQPRQAEVPPWPWVIAESRRRRMDMPRLTADVERALHILQELRERRLPRTDEMYGVVIDALGRSKNPQLATQLFATLVYDWGYRKAATQPDATEREWVLANILRCQEANQGYWKQDDKRNTKELLWDEAQALRLHDPSLSLPHPAKLLPRLTTTFDFSHGELPEYGLDPKTGRSRSFQPKDHPRLFWTLDSVRILTNFLLYKLLPLASYHDFESIAQTFKKVPKNPKYLVFVNPLPYRKKDSRQVPESQAGTVSKREVIVEPHPQKRFGTPLYEVVNFVRRSLVGTNVLDRQRHRPSHQRKGQLPATIPVPSSSTLYATPRARMYGRKERLTTSGPVAPLNPDVSQVLSGAT